MPLISLIRQTFTTTKELFQTFCCVMADKYNDEDLLHDFMKGSPLAFQEIFRRYHDKIYFTCFRITRNMQEAQDITLVTLQKLFSKYADFDNLGQAGTFLYVTARNRSLNYIRDVKKLHDRQNELVKTLATTADSFQDELDAEYLHMVVKGMETLPERARLVLQLRYMENLKNPEIAKMLGISVNTVKNHLAQSIDKLRKSLNDRRLTELVVTALALLFLH